MEDFLDRLNAPQRLAVETLEGPLLVLAGAGSGKTRVVTYRIVNLLKHGIPAKNILGLTFTNKAAQEMRNRVQDMSNSDVLISTFHSLGSRILRHSIDLLGFRRDYTLYDDEDSNKLLRSCCLELGFGEEKSTVKLMKSFISGLKNHPLVLFKDNLSRNSEYEVFNLYQRKLKEYNAVDFDDLLLLPVRIFFEFPDTLEHYQNRWQYLLIDEYQDTNEAQYLLIKYLTEKTQNLCVVGDPDQSIYSWRGAQIQNIINFEQDFPGALVVPLEQNYRSRSNILEVANSLISHNESRHEKKLWSDRGDGPGIKQFIGYNDKEEADFVASCLTYHHEHDKLPWNQMVVFYRTHAQSRIFEDFFYSRRVPYVIVGGLSFYQRREVKDILAYLKIVYSGSDFIAFSRTINLPKRGLGDVTLEKIRQGATEEELSILDFCHALVKNAPLKTPLKLSAKQKLNLAGYLQMIQELREGYTTGSLRELVLCTIAKCDYFNYLKEDPESFEDRKANLDS
ncbi:MAG: UvrD-helicase domain-containing protein, partial [Parachlamydiaceae bacterium]|nr:UvrD-helicase domain-containing protein [Parachlamydiaceae bacterium]